MTAERDPRRPRPNSRARHIERRMKDCWTSFRKAKDHEIRRDSLTTLRDLITRWLVEPEVVHDLESGRSVYEARDRQRWSKLGPDVTEFPFDRGGEACSGYFYFGSGTCSEMMSAATVKADPDCVFGKVAYFVTLVEKHYATAGKTMMHFSSEQAFRVHVRRSRTEPRLSPGVFVVFVDCAGSSDGKARAAYASVSHERARARADRIAADFHVRCVVGRVVRSIDTH